MKRKRPTPAKPPRNPHARALGTALFRQKVERKKGEYRRRPKHRKPEDAGAPDDAPHA